MLTTPLQRILALAAIALLLTISNAHAFLDDDNSVPKEWVAPPDTRTQEQKEKDERDTIHSMIDEDLDSCNGNQMCIAKQLEFYRYYWPKEFQSWQEVR